MTVKHYADAAFAHRIAASFSRQDGKYGAVWSYQAISSTRAYCVTDAKDVSWANNTIPRDAILEWTYENGIPNDRRHREKV